MAVNVGMKLILVAVVLVLVSQAQPVVFVCVDGKNGNDEVCLFPGSEIPCRSLERIAKVVPSMNVSRLEITVQNELELRNMVTFNNFLEIRLSGSQAQNNVTCGPNDDNSAGLVFTSVQNITIENLTFSQCGAFQNYTTYSAESERQIRAAIHIWSSTNVAVTKVVLMFNNGTGLLITDVQGGVIKVMNVIFDRNVIERQSTYDGGGGVFVWQWRQHRNNFIFENCLFLSNGVNAANPHDNTTAFGSIIPSGGRGGGIQILLTNVAALNKVSVSNCNFTGNVALLGGGLGVYMQGNSQNNSILVENSIFTQNGFQNGACSGSGGGAIFGYDFRSMNQSLTKRLYNNISVINTTFKDNCAKVGGGITFYSSRDEYINLNNSITFSGCKWIANKARLGAAVDILPHVFDRHTRGLFPTPIFTNCEFINNTVTSTTQYTFGTGTFFSSLLDVTFQSAVNFERNSGSAFIIVNGIADFSSCNATFINNTGVQGGAVALIGVSSMHVGPHCTYTFIQNSATDQGGAIYVHMTDEHDFFVSRSCFIQYSENLHQPSLIPISNWTSTFIFKNNFAQRYGHAIFATSVVPCQFRSYGLSDFKSYRVFVFENDDSVEHQIVTDGARFNITGSLPVVVIPGQEYVLRIESLDDFDQQVDIPIRASVINESKGTPEVDNALFITGNTIQLLGEEGEKAQLLLQSSTERKSSIVVNVMLSQCPIGFIINENYQECLCDAQSYEGITYCNHTEFQAYLEEDFWLGYIGEDTTELATGLCPEDFCGFNTNRSNLYRSAKLPQFASHSELDKIICGPRRTGIICGRCIAGHTVYYNSRKYQCREMHLCKVGWLFYILSELVPITIFFISVLTFNISFTSGSINGLILFSQILDTLYLSGNGVIEVPDHIKFMSWGYFIIYGFFSLNFFSIEPLSFCLLRNATVLDILSFKYVTVAYSFILILSVIMFMRHCAPRMLGKHFKLSFIKNSVIHGLSAFIVVSYAQCINVSLKLLLPTTLGKRGALPLYPRRVWFNGEFVVFSKEHLPYAIPALLFLIIVGVILPVLLVAYPLVNKILAFCGISESHAVMSLSKRVHISKLKPFLDSFQGCFKDNFRFFAGFYFLYRWISPLAHAALSVSLGGYYALVEAVLIIVLVVHAVAQPYMIQWHNIVDALLLGNLAIINGFTSLAYYYSRGTPTLRDQKSVAIIVSIQLVFIYLPILFYIGASILVICNKYCLPNVLRVIRSSRKQSMNDANLNLTNSNANISIPLEEFPARLLGDDVEYEEFPGSVFENDMETIFGNDVDEEILSHSRNDTY